MSGIIPKFSTELEELRLGENYFSEFESEETRLLAEQYADPKYGIQNWNKKQKPLGGAAAPQFNPPAGPTISIGNNSESVIVSQLRKENKEFKEEIQTLKENQQKWENFKSNRNFFLSKLAEKSKEKQKQEALEIEIWNLKKFIATKISSFSDLPIKTKLGNGCDGIVFLCNADGIVEVALKLIVNMGVLTKDVKKSFGNEFEVLKSIPLHKNIIPILGEFKDRPSDLIFAEYPPALQQVALHEDGKTKRMTQCIMMPALNCFKAYWQQNLATMTIGQKLGFI